MTDFIHAPPNEAPIDDLYAFLSIDENGEGIVSAIVMPLGATPLVTGKLRIAELMKAQAVMFGKITGRSIRMVRFSRAEVLWSNEP